MKKQQKLVDLRKALTDRQLNGQQSAAIKGGDVLELYPWIDSPGG